MYLLSHRVDLGEIEELPSERQPHRLWWKFRRRNGDGPIGAMGPTIGSSAGEVSPFVNAPAMVRAPPVENCQPHHGMHTGFDGTRIHIVMKLFGFRSATAMLLQNYQRQAAVQYRHSELFVVCLTLPIAKTPTLANESRTVVRAQWPHRRVKRAGENAEMYPPQSCARVCVS
jgi:hypothetical protein